MCENYNQSLLLTRKSQSDTVLIFKEMYYQHVFLKYDCEYEEEVDPKGPHTDSSSENKWQEAHDELSEMQADSRKSTLSLDTSWSENSGYFNRNRVSPLPVSDDGSLGDDDEPAAVAAAVPDDIEEPVNRYYRPRPLRIFQYNLFPNQRDDDDPIDLILSRLVQAKLITQHESENMPIRGISEVELVEFFENHEQTRAEHIVFEYIKIFVLLEEYMKVSLRDNIDLGLSERFSYGRAYGVVDDEEGISEDTDYLQQSIHEDEREEDIDDDELEYAEESHYEVEQPTNGTKRSNYE